LGREINDDDFQLMMQKRKAPAVGLGGLRLGLLIFETKTHPVTVDTMIGPRIRFLRFSKRYKRRGFDPLSFQRTAAAEQRQFSAIPAIQSCLIFPKRR
jgi:hypothetical protein